ncbi:protein DEHYDRATION-INDUCED 19 homolog 4-like isoform X2 [Corylus avellana]|uniref:protein DEHYDRATION-INDUCED 19 homolog 4-like isoform X2 n=1 Tax=Corylus avellana TaxID=13451 RepID=UPI00286A908B|nr:protein DEHYDRATION-INDUCED 19 homolog 4-like isoform X2 [Corylus avellana]
MDSDAWTARLSNASRRYHSRSDLYLGGGHEEIDGDDESRAEFLCPFCAEDYDVVGLCCHIDEEHPVEAKNGVCPICAKRVGTDIVGHVTMQHGNFLKVQRKRRFRKGGSNSTFSILRKELRDGNLQSLFGGSSCIVSSNTEPDPLLSSFIYNAPIVDETQSVQPRSLVEASLIKESSKEDFLERNVKQLLLSDKEQEEKTRKCEFIQGLMMSTVFDDDDL